MAGTVVAVFENKQEAEHAAQALLDSGVSYNDISLVRKGAGAEAGDPDIDGSHPDDDEEEFISHAVREVPMHDVEQPLSRAQEVGPRAAVGVVMGSAIGALLVSTAIVFPGFGLLLAAGPLAAMMTGGIGGGVVGGLVGALTSGGIPEAVAQNYHDHVENGHTLVTVLAGNDNAKQIADLLLNRSGLDIGYYPRFIDSMQSLES